MVKRQTEEQKMAKKEASLRCSCCDNRSHASLKARRNHEAYKRAHGDDVPLRQAAKDHGFHPKGETPLNRYRALAAKYKKRSVRRLAQLDVALKFINQLRQDLAAAGLTVPSVPDLG